MNDVGVKKAVGGNEHNQRIVEAFTTQAIPFAQMHSDEESMRLLLDTAKIGADDVVLDVACGPGVVACAAAARAKHVTGIDITPAMIDEARRRSRAGGLQNMSWEVGDVERLPFATGTFSVVICRFALHHMESPGMVLREMARVCRPDGRVVIADMFVRNAAQGVALDGMERIRDGSHVHALDLRELVEMFAAAGFPASTQAFFRVPVEVDALLRMTGTSFENSTRVRELVRADIGKDVMGIEAHEAAGVLEFSFPVVVLGGVKVIR